MKGKYRAEFVGFRKIDKAPGWALKLLSIKDERNVPVAREGTVTLSKGIRNLGTLKEGDLLEFDAEVKEVSFEYPKNIKLIKKGLKSENRNKLKSFFDVKDAGEPN